MAGLSWSSRRSDFVALLVSGVAAALAPLPVFLLAFVILGPMHYLTEIVWLQKKSFYFSDGLISPKWYGVIAYSTDSARETQGDRPQRRKKYNAPRAMSQKPRT